MRSEDSSLDEQRIVVVYERVSTDHQDIARQAVQRDRAKADYPERDVVIDCVGLTPEGAILVIQDDGISAFKRTIFDRPGGKRLCSLVGAGVVEALYADAQDRLSRGRLAEWVNFKALCDDHSTRILINGRELRADDEADEMLAAFEAMRARRESAEKSHRIKGAKRRAAEQGRPHGGWSPYGYRYGRLLDGEPQGLIVVPAEAEIVRRIFREWRQGKPQTQITHGLNTDGVRPQRVAMWGQSSVGRMLRNPAYAALREIDGGLIAANHDPIIPRDEWEEAQRLLAPPGSKKRSGRPAPGFLLRGLLICGRCGAPMWTERSGRGHCRYVCSTRERNPEACSQRGVRRADIDEGVLSYFEDTCIDAEASWRASREATNARIAETRMLREHAERETIRLSAQLDRADDDYGSGALDATDYKRLRAKWSDERDATRAEGERLLAREKELDQAASPDFMERLALVREAVADRIRDARDDAGIETVRAALRSLFESFAVSDARTAPGAAKSYKLVPRLRTDVAGGTAPIPGQKVAMVFPPDDGDPAREAEQKYHVAEALSYRTPGELAA
jgi:DNA invertase Pin-like site-specific DNA recombinase